MKGALLGLLLILAACQDSPTLDIAAVQATLDAYNSHNAKIADLVASHNALIAAVREAVGDDAAYRQAVTAYLTFAEQRKPEFLAFADFVRAQDAFLRERNVDTTALLANLQNTVDTMDRNAKDFRDYLANAEPGGIATSSHQSRFRTIPLYR